MAVEGRKDPGRDGQIEAVPPASRQVYVAGALLGKGILEAEAQFQPSSASDPGLGGGLLAQVQPG